MGSKRGSGGGSKRSSGREVHRSAISGKFVTERYAETHPKTTVTEKVKPGGSPPGTKGAKPKSFQEPHILLTLIAQLLTKLRLNHVDEATRIQI